MVSRRMYITGGIGSQAHGEGFTIDYDLPSSRAYAETCAAIGLFFWGTACCSWSRITDTRMRWSGRCTTVF